MSPGADGILYEKEKKHRTEPVHSGIYFLTTVVVLVFVTNESGQYNFTTVI